jgi:hypothetical protein
MPYGACRRCCGMRAIRREGRTRRKACHGERRPGGSVFSINILKKYSQELFSRIQRTVRCTLYSQHVSQPSHRSSVSSRSHGAGEPHARIRTCRRECMRKRLCIWLPCRVQDVPAYVRSYHGASMGRAPGLPALRVGGRARRRQVLSRAKQGGSPLPRGCCAAVGGFDRDWAGSLAQAGAAFVGVSWDPSRCSHSS